MTTTTIWRYSHLTLAVSSFLFLLLASVSGIILSVEPITEKVKSYRVSNLDDRKLADVIPALKTKYSEITSITIVNNQFVEIQAIDTGGNDVKGYIDPVSGQFLGNAVKQNEFYQWVTGFHRSLFLHETGRFFIGLTSFLLMLIAVSGIVLTIKRQRGITRLFSKIQKDGFSQYYHVVLGRILLVPIFLIALSGTYLSMNTLGMLKTPEASLEVDFDAIKSLPVKSLQDFEVLKNISLSDVVRIEFPFSEDVEDYFILNLKDRELAINQITGEVLAENKYPFTILMTNLSLNVHTGKTSTIWAVVLGVSSIGILFFIYSGFAITLKRISKRTKNKYQSEECEFILLVGSENGSTYGYAISLHKVLLKQGKKSYLASMNTYTIFPKAKQLVVFTSTYGLGEAPANASRFLKLIADKSQVQTVHYSVLGFGSKAYPDFCKYAFDVHNDLSKQPWALPLIDVHTVNDKNPQDLLLWAESWSQQSEIQVSGFAEQTKKNPRSVRRFKVKSNTSVATGEGTFQLKLTAAGKLKAKSGDLLAIYPANDHRERLYSIGVVDEAIQLSVRLHPGGLGSGFLAALKINESVNVRILKNPHFYFPQKASAVIMISNGTGIAPFLGMIDQNQKRIPSYLYCGFRSILSFEPFSEFLNVKLQESKITATKAAYSREGNNQYVSDLIRLDADFIAKCLLKSAVIMICGSLAMQKDIVDILEHICLEKTGQPLSFYQSRNQVLTDCY